LKACKPKAAEISSEGGCSARYLTSSFAVKSNSACFTSGLFANNYDEYLIEFMVIDPKKYYISTDFFQDNA
jgi:hypothetical protein